ncbi:uncharacterized protein LOC113768971 [Coffea eugenioides]|uniref:uncharacterized protein LOC113768971 n=1 Tax=Coffea eugenioides TaxID=49369 RepID=UPI000F612F5C|nr:uncharacterized protein LOC113768971 [Coffea eugenioides]
MTDILERLAERQGPGPLNQPGPQDRGEDRALERFLKFNSPKFTGEPNSEVAENWLERMTNIFAALDYTEDRRVNFAAFQFERVAHAWWDMIREKWERVQTPWNWKNFTREFNEKFLPPLIQEKREDEFIKLTKGRGLGCTLTGGTFTEALEKAQRVESTRMQASKSAPPSKMGRGTGGVRTAGASRGVLSREGRSGPVQARGVPSSGLAVTPRVNCGYYGKPNHSENDCWRKLGKCLFCGSAEYQLAGCPKALRVGGSTQRPEKSTSKQTSTGGSHPKVPARVYALDYQ